MAIELVVFDLAGTTVDDGDAVNRCLRATLAAAGFEASSEEVNNVMGLPKPEAIRQPRRGHAAGQPDRRDPRRLHGADVSVLC